MQGYKTAYELYLDSVDLQLCLDTDYNQPDYDGSRQPSPEPENGCSADGDSRT